MIINRRNKISFLLLFLFVNILAIGQTYYYKQTKIVINKQTNKGDYSGQFITFISDRCYDSDNKGYTVENGVLQLLKETANIKIYYGPSYWGKAYYYVSNDFNRINIKIEDNGKILVYEKSIPKVYNWKEIFEYIIEYKKEKLNVILDTDTYNECDDQFALAYMIKNQDIFNIEAITVAPYSHKNRNETVISGREKSYNEILKICNWLDFNTTNKVFKGAEDYIHNGYEEYNDAVDKIIEVALKNNKTYIMAIGAITNIAIAIKKEPRIIDKIEVIWLGGNELGYKDNLEYNFRQDIEAIKIVFESKIKLTILPCENVVSALKININTLKERIGNKSKLCDYLIDRFYNDGYHGIQKERVIWDISVIAYMINRNWFKTTEVSCPDIKDDTSYEITENNHKITFVTELDRDKIYENLLEKL